MRPTRSLDTGGRSETTDRGPPTASSRERTSKELPSRCQGGCRGLTGPTWKSDVHGVPVPETISGPEVEELIKGR